MKENMQEFVLNIVKNEKLEEEYRTIEMANLSELPNSVWDFMKAFEDNNPYIYKTLNRFQLFNDLFVQYRNITAIKYVENFLNDVTLTKEKIEKIYGHYSRDWVPTKEVAQEEVDNFIRFIQI